MFLTALVLGGALLFGARLFEVPKSIKPPEDPAPPTEDPRVEEERALDRGIAVSAGGLGLAIGGALVLPPLSLVSAATVLYGCRPLFRRAYHAIVEERRLRASFLDAFGVLAALAAGFYVASALTGTVYLVGRKLLLKTEDRSRTTLASIFGEQQRSVWLVRGDVEIEVPIEHVGPGDLIVVDAGQFVPVDGTIRAGAASIDQRALTGESQPTDKGAGDRVLAATLVLSGKIHVEVERAGESTLVAQIGTILNRTADYRTETESWGERVGDQSVLPLLGLSGAALALRGTNAAVAVLYASYTENMRVAVPLSMLNYLNRAARLGILVKDGRALELLGKVDTCVFDKTGTLTEETPNVGEIHVSDGSDPETLLAYAAAAEVKQSHPIARAILARAAALSIPLPPLGHVRYEGGRGVAAESEGRRILVGSARYMGESGVDIPESIESRAAEAHERGHSLVYVAVDGRLGGAIELRPTARPELLSVLTELRARGLAIYIISGDHEAPTRHLARELGVERAFAGVMPDDKAALVAQLEREGRRVCFIGDGINDAIALKTATASVSLRGATSAATDTAQVVLMDGTLRNLPRLFELAGQFDRNVRTSFITTFGPSAICVGGVFLFHWGIFTSIALFNASLLLSVVNAMLPALASDGQARNVERALAPPKASSVVIDAA